MSTKDDENRRDAARMLGMKPLEVLEVKAAEGGILIKTHDGNWTLAREVDGRLELEFRGHDPNTAEVEAPPVEEPAKAAPKGRGRA